MAEPAWWAEARQMAADGLSRPKIAERCGVSEQAVYHACSERRRAAVKGYAREFRARQRAVEARLEAAEYEMWLDRNTK